MVALDFGISSQVDRLVESLAGQALGPTDQATTEDALAIDHRVFEQLVGQVGLQHQMQAEAAVIGTQAFPSHGARPVDRAAIPQCRQGGDRLEQVLFAHGAAAQELATFIIEQAHAGQTLAQAFDQGLNGGLGNDQSRWYRLGQLTAFRLSTHC
ncbi:hypothetical protein D3C72_1204010 [compost metagenome]